MRGVAEVREAVRRRRCGRIPHWVSAGRALLLPRASLACRARACAGISTARCCRGSSRRSRISRATLLACARRARTRCSRATPRSRARARRPTRSAQRRAWRFAPRGSTVTRPAASTATGSTARATAPRRPPRRLIRSRARSQRCVAPRLALVSSSDPTFRDESPGTNRSVALRPVGISASFANCVSESHTNTANITLSPDCWTVDARRRSIEAEHALIIGSGGMAATGARSEPAALRTARRVLAHLRVRAAMRAELDAAAHDRDRGRLRAALTRVHTLEAAHRSALSESVCEQARHE